jgi:S1-C subfamily serine protease
MKFTSSKTISYIVLAAVLGFVLNLLFADSLVARMSTWHWVQKYHLVTPRAPLVINRTEEVRVNDGSDSVAAVNKTKGRVVAVADISSGSPVLRGAAVAVTSDGSLFTVTAALAGAKPENIIVITSEGKRFPVTSTVSEQLTGVVVLKTNASFSAASFASSSDLRVGSRVLLLGALTDGSPYVLSSFLSSGEHPVGGVVSSDSFNHMVGFQSVDGAVPGQAAIDLSGQVVGLWDGQQLISATVLQSLVGNFLSHNGKFSWASYGFYYRVVSAEDATASGASAGLLVSRTSDGKPAVLAGSAAAKAGLLEGDLITKIDGQPAADGFVDSRLLSFSGRVNFDVVRAGKQISLGVIPNIQ